MRENLESGCTTSDGTLNTGLMSPHGMKARSLSGDLSELLPPVR